MLRTAIATYFDLPGGFCENMILCALPGWFSDQNLTSLEMTANYPELIRS